MVYNVQVVQLLGVPKLVNGIRVKQLAMLLLQLSKSGWGLKVWLMPCAMIPLLPMQQTKLSLLCYRDQTWQESVASGMSTSCIRNCGLRRVQTLL